ncbi:MAG: DUF1285 domain-containing protein [Myxococcales bacterium]|nr:DUF1285 domain-containing protein [Myxococcales bacterium]
MKPGDHPEFFRFPPPPGRSRESTIRLDRNGRFWHDDAPVEHSQMAKAFAAWISKHPDDGRFILTNGYDWTYFSVEDTPFFVSGVRLSDGVVELELSDGSSEPMDPSTLREGPDGALYLKVKDGQFDARFQPSAQLELAPLLVEADGGVGLEIGGQRFSVPPR